MGFDKFYKNSFILTLSNLVTGAIGFIFSIVLSRQIGAEGLGLYGIIAPVYILLLGLTSDGLVTALSKISAVYYNKKDFRNLNRTLSTIFFVIIFWSLAIILLVYTNSSFIGSHIIRDPRSILALKIICPALLFVPMSAILKGYYYGIDQFKIAAFIDIFEKFLRVAVFLGTISALSLREIKSTVTAAYFALVVGEFASFILLYAFYKKFKSRNTSNAHKSQNRFQLLYNLLKISCPLCVNGFISSLLSTAATLVLPWRLVHSGMQYGSALSLIGRFSGMALNITFLPFIIVSSISTVLVPDLSLSVSKKDYFSTEKRIIQVFKIAYLIGISTLVVSLTVPDSLGLLLYKRNDLGNFIRFAAAASIFSYVSSPTFGILNGLGKQNVILRNSLIISVQGLILIFILTGIPSINIYGYGISLVVTSLTALILNIREIKKVCELRLPLAEAFIYTVIGAFSFYILRIFSKMIPDSLLIVKSGFTVMLAFLLVFSLSRIVTRRLARLTYS